MQKHFSCSYIDTNISFSDDQAISQIRKSVQQHIKSQNIIQNQKYSSEIKLKQLDSKVYLHNYIDRTIERRQQQFKDMDSKFSEQKQQLLASQKKLGRNQIISVYDTQRNIYVKKAQIKDQNRKTVQEQKRLASIELLQLQAKK